MTGLKIEGVVFDVDGVLFDTERLTQQTWLAVSREMGWPQVGEAYLEFVGQNRADIFQKMEDLFGAEFPKDAFMAACSARSQARMETEGVPMKPGVGEVLELLRSRGVPTALATSTGRPRTERRMEMTGLGPCFSAIITGDQVAHSKPDPEIYLMACRALGTTPERTVAVEDSRNGILSASRAGMRVAMVPDLLPPTPELEPLLWGALRLPAPAAGPSGKGAGLNQKDTPGPLRKEVQALFSDLRSPEKPRPSAHSRSSPS